jgi:hypothetical protein
VTPAVTAAQTALSDAMTARDRECKGGIGKFCREREAEVAARRQVLDGASAKVGRPQTRRPRRPCAPSSGSRTECSSRRGITSGCSA